MREDELLVLEDTSYRTKGQRSELGADAALCFGVSRRSGLRVHIHIDHMIKLQLHHNEINQTH